MSSVANQNYHRTYEIIDFDTCPPDLCKETDSHYIYYCPVCITKRGKSDEEGKFYYSKVKNSGLCFKCNSVFFPKNDEIDDSGNSELNYVLDRAISSLSGPDEYIDPPSIGFKDFDELEFKHLEYLRSRHIFLPLLAPLLQCRAWNGSTLDGVIFPYFYKEYVCNYQVRFNTTDKKRRYYLPKGLQKVLYSPTHILTDFKLRESSTVTICEGIFDSIALLIMGYPNVLAIQGSSITKYELMQLRKLMPNNAFVVMDKYEISEAICDQLSQLPSISGTQIVSFGDNVDPEDQLKKLLKDPENIKLYGNQVQHLLMSVRN